MIYYNIDIKNKRENIKNKIRYKKKKEIMEVFITYIKRLKKSNCSYFNKCDKYY